MIAGVETSRVVRAVSKSRKIGLKTKARISYTRPVSDLNQVHSDRGYMAVFRGLFKARFKEVAPRAEIPGFWIIKDLQGLTTLGVDSDRKGLFRAVANPKSEWPPDPKMRCPAAGNDGAGSQALIAGVNEQGETSAAGAVQQVRRRLDSIFPRRKAHRSPDRKASRDRQRMFGGASHMPPHMRQHYTQGERAALYVISAEAKRTGACDWPIAKIAAMAGVSRTTAQNAMRQAQRLGHIKVTQRPVRGRKNLTNVVTIISREWQAWLKRGPIGFKMPNPTKNTERDSIGRGTYSLRFHRMRANSGEWLGGDKPWLSDPLYGGMSEEAARLSYEAAVRKGQA